MLHNVANQISVEIVVKLKLNENLLEDLFLFGEEVDL